MKTQMVTKDDTRNIINIITELENMKDIYLVCEKRQIGESNKERVLGIMNDLDFLRHLASNLDKNGENKKILKETMTQTSEQILEQYEKDNKSNQKINMVMLATIAVAIIGIVFANQITN